MFAEPCNKDSIKASENTTATVICYKNDPQLIPTCSSTVDQETTSISSVVTSSIQGAPSTTATTATTTTIPGCHTCSGSNYINTCYGCSNSSAGCEISCTCYGGSGLTNSSITLSPGFGNGCFVENVNGQLQCTSRCT
ncbi:unnamed protein product [Adineta steineri]|uniref:Uncharacterized protein n=1 Tax=Adineta steineri TaxID=433720 RepID=A0A815AJY4_9BILA|nr:unnamed protein product [Adineta steineri]CAF1542918.1 unnamed protein product [Adineta steineri]